MKIIITNKELFYNRALLPKKEKAAWLKALRSGKYEKGTGHLQKDNKFCCLGILCDIQKLPSRKVYEFIYYDEQKDLLPTSSPLYSILGQDGDLSGFSVKINNTRVNSLAQINDLTTTFDEVIEVIKKYF
jgi:hypothetical protein